MDKEKKLYHPQVNVQWQEKAWYSADLCVEYASTVWSKHWAKSAKNKGRFFAVIDNLHGQTTPEFRHRMAALGCDVWFGPSRMTDDWQVIDRGPGKLLKDKMGELMDEDEDLADPERRAKLTASDRRVKLTHYLWAAHEIVCQKFDFEHAFDATGCSMTKNGLRKHKVDGVDVAIPVNFQSLKKHKEENPNYEFTFNLKDTTLPANATDNNVSFEHGPTPTNTNASSSDDQPTASNDNDDSDNDNEELEVSGQEQRSVDDVNDDDIASSEDEAEEENLDPYPTSFNKEWIPQEIETGSDMKSHIKVGTKVAHTFTTGWEIGTVIKITQNGKKPWVLYEGDNDHYPHQFQQSQYGTDKTWVIVTPKE
jgi:hypothetical protein